MKKNKLFTIASLTSLGAIASMSPTLISCTKKPFDQRNDGKIVISTGFSLTGNQGKGLIEKVNEYNKWIGYNSDKDIWEGTNKKAEGYMPLEVVANPNGYSTSTLRLKLTSKDKTELFNIFVNYPSAAALLAEWKMNLAMDEADYESFGLASSFKTINDNIAFNTKKEKWVVPLGRSSEMGSVNKIVIGKILSDLKEKGAQLDGTHSNIDSYIEAYNNSQEKDFPDFKKKWVVKSDIKQSVLDVIKKLKLTDDMFDTYASLIDFSILAKSIYEPNASAYIIGIDSFPSAVNLMTSSITKSDIKKNYISYKPDSTAKKIIATGGYDFESFRFNKNSEEHKLFKKIIEKLLHAINSKALWVGGGGQYGSDHLKNHLLGISYGSTAGYSKTYFGENDKIVKYKGTLNTKDIEKVSTIVQLNGKNPEAGILFKFDTTNGHTNKIFSSTNEKEAGKYDYKSKDQNSDNAISGLADKSFLVSSSNLSVQGSNVIFTDNNKKTHIVPKAKHLGQIFKNNEYDFFAFESTEFEFAKADNQNTLQKREATWISNPHYAFDKANETAAIFTQGPSLVLIHANDEEDKATKLFVKWFYTKRSDGTTPVEDFNKAGSYITPTSEFLSYTPEQLEKNKKFKLNDAQKIAFENFKKSISESATYKLVDDVPAFKSALVRDNLGTAARQAVNASSGKTFEKFLEEVNQGLI
ncbi:P80 family lipoprotein [Metamycoplasma hyosynoviae]|nr:P80 family lipoprotein [Metamycoplasma hyosynoviae]MDC8913610.1 P80 family lipoprotein [Metamycoplasma hyosynoviae]